MNPVKNSRSCPLDKLRNVDVNKMKNFYSKLIKCGNITEQLWSKKDMINRNKHKPNLCVQKSL